MAIASALALKALLETNKFKDEYAFFLFLAFLSGVIYILLFRNNFALLIGLITYFTAKRYIDFDNIDQKQIEPITAGFGLIIFPTILAVSIFSGQNLHHNLGFQPEDVENLFLFAIMGFMTTTGFIAAFIKRQDHIPRYLRLASYIMIGLSLLCFGISSYDVGITKRFLVNIGRSFIFYT
jgi:hypothetical protein